MAGGKRTINLDRHTELELAVGYAKRLAEKGSHPDIDTRLLPKGAVMRARELIDYSYGHQIIKAYVEVLSSFNRLEEEMRVNDAKIANVAEDARKNLVKVSGYVGSAIALIDEMFQNYGKIGVQEKRKDIGTLRCRFEDIKGKAVQLSKDYDDALDSDAGKAFEHGQKLSAITASATTATAATGSLWDVMVCLTHSVDDLTTRSFDDGTLGMLYESFVDSIISSLLEKGARQVSE